MEENKVRKRISKIEWYGLSEEEREAFEFVSNEEGCFFIEKEVPKTSNVDETDDFDRLNKKD
ncbi:hypothetical protein K5G30_002380 [Enterococcus faecalis]|nr:hypothetical protein [Enterococcus faecalis]